MWPWEQYVSAFCQAMEAEAAALADTTNSGHLSPYQARAVGRKDLMNDTCNAAELAGAIDLDAPSDGAADDIEQPPRVVNAVHAHSEFWLPALQLCAAELGWTVDTSGDAAGEPASFVYLPPGAGRFAFMQAPMAQRFPGLRFATRKVALGRCFGWVQQLVPGALAFSPQTWLLPDGLAAFESVSSELPAPWLILKPDGGCRGRGIQLCSGVEQTRTAWLAMDADVAAGKKTPPAAEPAPDSAAEPEPEPKPEPEPEAEAPPPPAVVQRYIDKPWLWDGAKWDLRIYVLITAVSPAMEAFVAPTALARRCTMPYEAPTASNASCDRMHLSNTSVNTAKTEEDGAKDPAAAAGQPEPAALEEEADEGDGDAECKRTLADAWAELEAGGVDTASLWGRIRDDVISKTLECMLPAVSLAYEQSYPPPRTRGGAPVEPPKQRCFQVLGFDVMLDESGAPHILEVNHNPSFAVPTPLDKQIKGSVMLSALSKVFGDTPRAAEPGEAAPQLEMLDWEPVAPPPEGDATLILREIKAAFDDLRLPPARVSRGGAPPPPRTGPATVGKVGRKRLKAALSDVTMGELLGDQQAGAGLDFVGRFGKPGTEVTWERFTDVVVQMVMTAPGEVGAGDAGRVALLRTVLQRIVEAKA